MALTLVVHGGAGAWAPDDLDGEAMAGCLKAARLGYRVLERGGRALDAVEAAVCALEDDPCFNAGRGAALTSEGTVELDAAVMDGEALRAGAVGALPPFQNPIRIARAILERSEHVLLVGEGARRFAQSQGFRGCAPEALITPRAWARYQARRATREGGTVGAAARDGLGHVAAATSTGGMLLKAPGRVGDSPLIGAGTYADDLGCAVSATGHGEAILRVALAAWVSGRVRGGAPPQAAADEALVELARVGGSGGLIAVDAQGRVGLAFNTQRMARASVTDGVEAAAFGRVDAPRPGARGTP